MSHPLRGARGPWGATSEASRRRSRWTLAPLALVLPVLAVATAACGGGSPQAQGVASLTGASKTTTTTTKGTADPKQAFLDYSRCMRLHGVDMPDPQFGTGPNGGQAVRVTGPKMDPDNPAVKAAMDACKPILDKAVNQGGLKKPSAADQERAIKFSQCMRQHGVNIPDPDFSGGGVSIRAGGANSPIDPNSPTFQAAQKACDKYFGPPGGKGSAGPVTQSNGAPGSGSGSNAGFSTSGGGQP
jgi:hypothetical protein